MTHDPIRLLDDATAAAGLRRDLAAAARTRAPYDVSAGAARFEASLAKGAGAASSGWGAGTLGVGALILGGLIGAGVWLSQPAAPIEAPPVVTVHAGEGARRAASEPPVEVLKVEDMVEGTVVAPSAAPPAHAEMDMSEEPEATVPAAKIKSRRAAARDAGARKVVVSGQSSADYLREAKSLQAARGFLGGEPAEALARAEAGAAEFKAGAFAQEWEGVAILALFALERRSEAEGRARSFLERYPNGPYAGQVREALDRP